MYALVVVAIPLPASTEGSENRAGQRADGAGALGKVCRTPTQFCLRRHEGAATI